MVNRIRAKLILRLHSQGISGRAIAASQGMSRHSISAVLQAAEAMGVSFEDVVEASDEDVYGLLFPGRGEHESIYVQPDWGRVHKELSRTGVTLKLLHGEYLDMCGEQNRLGMGYDRFCKSYEKWTRVQGVSSRVARKAARQVEAGLVGSDHGPC